MRSYAGTGMVGTLVLALMLAGCSDFSQHRFGGVRRNADGTDGPPTPAAALYIPNPPDVARTNTDGQLKQASFLPTGQSPKVDAPMVENPLRALYQRAAQRSAAMESYIYRLKRREVVDGRQQPEELVKVQLRREPFSVHLVWLGKEGKGREAIFVQGKYKGEMQLRLASGDMFPFSPAGMRFSIAPNDPMARAKSRHPITETGFATLIASYGRVVAAVEKGDAREGTVKYLGRVKRQEFEQLLEAVHQVLPAKNDPLLPKGGQRWWFFDIATGLPLLYITHDPTGEVEYYCHDRIQWPAPMDDNDFNPDRVWRK